MIEILEDHSLRAADLGPEDWVVDGVFTKSDRVLVVGGTKVGKSILALQLASCIAGNKTAFLNFTVPMTRRVLYIAGEGDVRELQKRRRRMEAVFPTQKDHLFFWPIPEKAFNTPAGKKSLIEVGLEYKPQLTIFDPIYSLMEGSMRDDEKVGDFVRAINFYQYSVKSAIVVMHHTHRPLKIANMWNSELKTVEEGDDAFYGSMLFKAWPHTVFLLSRNKDDSRTLSSSTHRDENPLGEPLQLTLIAPDPLYYTIRKDDYTPTDASVVAHLKVYGEKTEKELEQAFGKSHSTLATSLAKLVRMGEVIHNEAKPRRYTCK